MLLQSIVVYTLFILGLFSLGKQYSRNTVCIVSDGRLIVNSKHRSNSQWALVFIIILFSLMAGMRYDVGVDHLSYLYEYLTGDNPYIDKNEFLFSGISSLFYHAHIHPILFFSFLAFLTFSPNVICVLLF